MSATHKLAEKIKAHGLPVTYIFTPEPEDGLDDQLTIIEDKLYVQVPKDGERPFIVTIKAGLFVFHKAQLTDFALIERVKRQWYAMHGIIPKAAPIVEKFRRLSPKELDDWYEEHVGRRLLDDEPEIEGKPEHWKGVAEMAYLHQYGEDDEHMTFYRALKALP